MANSKQVSKLKTKDELLQIMSDHLTQQQEFALQLKEKAIYYVNLEGTKKEDTKMKNHFLNAYNTQVDAVSRTSSAMIKVYGSSLQNKDDSENEKKTKSLVD